MSEIILQAGDLLQDVHNGDLLLLIKKKDYFFTDGGEMWDFWNLTNGVVSWWYEVHLTDEQEFRRI